PPLDAQGRTSSKLILHLIVDPWTFVPPTSSGPRETSDYTARRRGCCSKRRTCVRAPYHNGYPANRPMESQSLLCRNCLGELWRCVRSIPGRSVLQPRRQLRAKETAFDGCIRSPEPPEDAQQRGPVPSPGQATERLRQDHSRHPTTLDRPVHLGS